MTMAFDQQGMLRIRGNGRNITLAPGDFETAQEVLTAEEFEIAQREWTPERIEQWQAAHPPGVEEPPRETPEERLARIEKALTEIATTGKLAREWATKRRA